MADNDRPRPPAALEPSLRESLVELAKRDPEALPAVAAYAEDLAAWVEAERNGSDSSDGDSDDDSDNGGYPPGVPERATVTVTEIAGTKYRYYQWREDDEIRSETVELSADDAIRSVD
ncbi:hypothetical protein [Halopiger xanaduensis]|uniref:Uncharacterized protein n=1 Tax=Halopiger xanaduensis (strain DSM 18323 / JCM 14033 / SH-6) TaxID=797210 RepID=F8D9Q5_HALXS|nr:hypothetical protein [Halopiger xanaduensis]AEH37580.1 hypothetical protein Halxa_2964 [Halopiger xanaduensis SH-6]